MEENLSFEKLRATSSIRCNSAFNPINAWSPSDWGVAMAGEMGEACNVIKKLRRLDDADKHLDTPELRAELSQKILDELADTVIYADLLATRLGLRLEDGIVRKFNEVSKRRNVDIYL